MNAAPFEDVEPDDFTARPHSAGSILRTFIGVHLRRIGGWIAVADLVDLCVQAGNSSGGVRSSLSRLKSKGVLEQQTQDGRPGYRVTPLTIRMLDRGDRRIYGPRIMSSDDGWLLAVFSVPDTERHLRHQLRRQLTWLGCGMITPGTWIGPGHLLEEAVDVLQQMGLRNFVTVLRTGDPMPPDDLATAVSRWWDFAELDERYGRFLAAHTDTAAKWDGSDEWAFVEHLRLIEDWRAIPYLDPGLPPELTPPGWRGHAGIELFMDLQSRLFPAAARYVDRVIAGEPGSDRGDPSTVAEQGKTA